MTANARGYTYAWQVARADYLLVHPLCGRCQALGIVSEARVVDHVIAHCGDQVLFWDRNNWQSLCKPCHDGWKQRVERG